MKTKLFSLLLISLVMISAFPSASQNNCVPPMGLATSNITTTGATLSWTAATGASVYMVQYRPLTNPVSSWTNVTTQTTSITLTTLTCGTQYEWQVASYCGSGAISAYSPVITFSTLACAVPCDPPTGLTTSNITTTGATLSWTAATGALVYMVQYRPVTNPVSSWTNVTTQTTSITLTTLTCGTQYEWQVASYCGSGTISAYSPGITFSTLACVVPCNPPTGLTTSNITTTGATLSWTASSGALGYVIQYRPITYQVSPWTNVSATSTSITLTNLTCGTHYEWRVASHCSNSLNYLSAYSPSITFTTLACTSACQPPSGLTTSNITTTGATLSWTASAGALVYMVQYRPVTNPVSAWTNVTTQTTSITLSSLTCGTHYQWRVASYCGSGTISAYSPGITFSTLACTSTCLPPTGLTTSNITTTGATLSWTASAGALAYLVQYRPVTNQVSPWINVTATTTSMILSNLACGTHYEWRVASYCGSVLNHLSIYSPGVTFSTLACTSACLPPTGLTTSNISATGATLSWTATSGVFAYIVQYRPISNTISPWTNITAATTSITLSNLACGTYYQWRVASYCGTSPNYMSAYSTGTTFSTLACTGTCVPPISLTTSNITTAGTANLSWMATTGALAYVVQYRPVTNPVSAWTNITAQTNSITLTNLACGTQYEWRVQSVCGTILGANYVSPWSAIVIFNVPTPVITYPNPISDNKFYLDVSTEVESQMNIIILDNFGNVLQVFDKTVYPGEGILDFDVSDLKNGMYFIHIQGENINELQKIVIMR